MKTKEEIKKWLDETSDEFIRWFETSDIDIPEHIKFIERHFNHLGICMVFNNSKQILSYDKYYNCFIIIPYILNIEDKAEYKLLECKYENLVAGDIFIYCSKEGDIQNRKEDLAVYTLFLGNDNCVYVSDDEDIINYNFSGNDCSHFYKVVKK